MNANWDDFFLPRCPLSDLHVCEGCNKQLEPVLIWTFRPANSHGELNAHWSFLAHDGNIGYYYENEDGDSFLKEADGTTHHNMRNGQFICHTATGDRQDFFIPNYNHPTVRVGFWFNVENGRRVY